MQYVYLKLSHIYTKCISVHQLEGTSATAAAAASNKLTRKLIIRCRFKQRYLNILGSNNAKSKLKL